MATIKFELRSDKQPANIYFRLSLSREKNFRRKTGFTINPDDWNNQTGMPKKGDGDRKIMASKLQRFSTSLHESINEATSKGVVIDGNWLQYQIDLHHGTRKKTDKDFLANYFDTYIENLQYKVKPDSKGSTSKRNIQKFATIKNKILAFEKYTKKQYYIKDVDLQFSNNFLKFLIEVDFLNKNTAGKYIKILKTLCRDAKRHGIETSPQLDFIQGFTEKAPKIFLTFDELDKLDNYKFKRESLKNAKDWLIIGCYIGQRVSDLLKLTKENIHDRNGLKLIELTQKKTGKKVAIPIHWKVDEILEKRNGNFPVKISAAKFNKHIKDACQLAGINETTKGSKLVFDEKNKVWRKRSGNYPKWELISSHVCRRSFASNFYGEIPTALLISITAHSTEKQFLEYIGKTSNDYAVQLAEYWSKEGIKTKKESVLNVVKQAN